MSNGAVDGWRRFGIRELVPMSARRTFDVPESTAPYLAERVAALAAPFVGVTTGGTVRTGLRTLDELPTVDTAPMSRAVSAFLDGLTPQQRVRARFAMDAPQWREWINVHMNFYRHGVLLDELPPPVRELALDVLRSVLSTRGFGQARAIMLVNELIAGLTGDDEAFGGWLYFVSVFGTPGTDEPWGWQIDGHHLCLNVVVVDGRVVTTPAFMGCEPRAVHEGPYAGVSLFDPEESLALQLVRSLDAAQRARAVIRPSIDPADLPLALQHPFDGRMQAGAAHDNLVAPYQGVAGAELDPGQRHVLLELIGTYLGWTADPVAAPRRREVQAHLDETWFSWFGATGDDAPFYYRLHSPVILIEFDHHPGVVFDNLVPTRHHVHTVVRTPNGGDYGIDLLRAHHAARDHTSAHGSV